jgi:hypothetical protein
VLVEERLISHNTFSYLEEMNDRESKNETLRSMQAEFVFDSQPQNMEQVGMGAMRGKIGESAAQILASLDEVENYLMRVK